MSRLYYTALIGAMFTVAGCGELPGFSVKSKTDSFQQVSVRNDKIDVLFIVDNSGSMAEEQQFLTDSFQDFITAFTSRNLDYQIGITTTDTRTNVANWGVGGAYHLYNNDLSGSLLYRKTAGFSKILSSAIPTADVITQFQTNAQFGTSGSGYESGILAAINFLSVSKLAGWNTGFVRDGAYLSIIVVSDEDESYGVTNATYIKTNTTDKNARISSFLSSIDRVKDNDRSRARFDAVVATDYTYCDTQVPGSVLAPDAVGTTYMELAAQLNGTSIPVCTNFGDELADIGEELVIAATRFKLNQVPDGDLEVYINDILVPNDATNGWVYLEDSNEIEFHGSAIPAAGSSIAVNYVPLNPN